MLKQVMDTIGAVLSRDSRGQCLLIPSDAELEEIARAAISAMRELPAEPGPRYTAGEYSRRTQEAMIDDALAKIDA